MFLPFTEIRGGEGAVGRGMNSGDEVLDRRYLEDSQVNSPMISNFERIQRQCLIGK